MTAIFSDKKIISELYRWLTGYTGGTAVGVVQMPIEIFNLVSQLQIESHGVLDMYRSRFWEAPEFCSKFEFGIFNFDCPFVSDDDFTIKAVFHRALKIKAKLPDGLRFVNSRVCIEGGYYQLSRWGTASTCLLE